VSEKVEATTGPDGNVQATFDGEALELVGSTTRPEDIPGMERAGRSSAGRQREDVLMVGDAAAGATREE
jgi:hypothetical protein